MVTTVLSALEQNKLGYQGPQHEYVHHAHVHEWERLHSFRGEKDGTEEEGIFSCGQTGNGRESEVL